MDRIKDEHQSTINKSDRWLYSRQTNMTEKDPEEIECHFAHSVRFYRALLNNYLSTKKDCLIMNLPCGEGRMIYTLKALGYQNIIGYDIDRARLKTGQKLGLPLKEGNCLEILINQDNNTIDVLFSMDFLEHLEKNTVIDFLKETQKKISPGGLLILRTPCADSPLGSSHIYNDFTHKWAATSGVLRHLLYNSGFSSVCVFGEEPTMNMRFGSVRIVAYQFARFFAILFIKAFGQAPPPIWSTSMWAVAQKE